MMAGGSGHRAVVVNGWSVNPDGRGRRRRTRDGMGARVGCGGDRHRESLGQRPTQQRVRWIEDNGVRIVEDEESIAQK
ncbi:uncharacterized protein BDCG_17953 [Blastomyces dermatitidis ER-3]|uniref:Uncharacterized protein n=2 Tax=Blastomyces TaxID=229219 RepID=A0A179V174_BLAGS|nr:uncharacterized protein BDBG_17751 [Blastomyces gilchristii SLH14081]XP_045282882.1 uncharacterized protein BDCG_17953 [Blastomyces dermatitidis ER-3]OAT03155.1 hypothetical protein BDCG_17953 [Blastomyces dermatitidis ER-3]OAT13209.1 hypothetical protein BDBG_17751 [Blastomyces gilchristii SLH14081]